jgi:hypothetical protein
MRKFILTLMACCILGLSLFAQSVAKPKEDVIIKINGDELRGKITEVNDDQIKFVYTNETVVYTIKKSDILKVTYSSGRIEVFNKVSLPSTTGDNAKTPAPVANAESHHNKIAILPFKMIRDGQETADAMGEQVQNECFSFLNKHAGVHSILNPRNTNKLLAKAGVNKDNVGTYSMEDLCNILGVEYIVDGIVTINQGVTTNMQSNYGNVNNNNKNNNTRFNSSSFGTTQQNFKTSLMLRIYNEKGEDVYNQERKAFATTQDAYVATLHYLLKRSPIYSK